MFINQWVEGALKWTASDVMALGPETGMWEFKSSRTEPKHLTGCVCPAASAFWNSGGGVLLLGVDNRGHIDGGIQLTVGNQSIRDRIDQALAQVQPLGPYEIHVIVGQGDHSAVEDGRGVVVVAFDESTMAPHMAHDGKYYIRAGAHTAQAGHFLVEAIRARRGVGRPLLRCLARVNPTHDALLDLVVAEVAGSPALDVSIRFDPTPPDIAVVEGSELELTVPVIGHGHPFSLAIGSVFEAYQPNGYGRFAVEVAYRDTMGRGYSDRHEIDVRRNLGPGLSVRGVMNEAAHELKVMSSCMRDLVCAARAIERRLPKSDGPREEPGSDGGSALIE